MTVGDTVMVRNTDHITKIIKKEGIWCILENKYEKDADNYYCEYQLIKINEQDKFHKIKQDC